MEGFREVVDVCQLCDIGYKGLDWTFEKKVAGGHFVRVRLDRVFASASWCSCFPLASVHHLMAVKSDHCPILFSLEPNDRSEYGQICNSVKDLKDKLCHLGEELGSWGKKTFDAIRRQL
jgi:hypothetical protein